MAEMSEGIAIENDSHYPPRGCVKFSYKPLALRARSGKISMYSADYYSVLQHNTSERSERVLNSGH